MTPLEFLIVLSVMLTLFVLRFGIPILAIWMGKFVCCRILHLKI